MVFLCPHICGSADKHKLFGSVINCNTYMDVSRETLNLKPNNLSPVHTRRDSSPQHKNITKKILYIIWWVTWN